MRDLNHFTYNWCILVNPLLATAMFFFFLGQIMRCSKRARAHMKCVFKSYHIQNNIHMSRNRLEDGKALSQNTDAFLGLKFDISG